MRWVGWLLFLLTVIGWVACEVPLSATSTARPDGRPDRIEWRRTEQGWQPAESWGPEPEPYRPALHPATAAALLALLSLLSLSALPGSGERHAANERKPLEG